MVEIYLKDLKKKSVLSEIKDHLLSDGLIVYPTDTLYGIGCNFYSLNGQKKIEEIKQRSDIPFSVAVSDFNMLSELTSQSLNSFKRIIDKISTSKMTFLFKIRNNIDKELVKGSELIGIRIIEIPEISELINFLGFPLVTTSVNISGSLPLNSPKEINEMLKSKPDIDIVLINGGLLPPSAGSTILDISSKKIRIIREGDNFLKIKKLISELDTI